MSYFETTKIKNSEGEVINPAQDESLTMLKRIFQALKPLGQVTGGGSNRLSVDVNSGSVIVSSGTISTIGNVTNVVNIGGVGAFDQMKAGSRVAYNTGNRANISF